MRKITLLLSFIVCVVFAQAQTNLVVNPSFETWTGGNPDGWTIPANVNHAGSLTWSQETTIVKDGTSALKLVIGTTENPGFQQIIPITAGKTYTVSGSYYVTAGDLTDARIWCSFKSGTAFYNATSWTAAVAKDPTIQVKLQGSGTSTGGYFTIDNNTWGTYTTDFVAPADATDFVLEFRTYKGATVIWDKMSLVQKNTTGTSNPAEDPLQAFVSGKNLVIKNAVNGSTVEIFSALGSKVQTSVLEDGKVSLDNLSKGLYIVRIGKDTKKFML